MAQETSLEGGHLSGSPLVSLGGAVLTDGRGRSLTQGYVTAVIGGVSIMESNPRRISALIQNSGGFNVHVFLGAPSYYAVVLGPGGSLQIDNDFPWTGSVAVLAPAGDSQVNFTEISLP